MNSAWVRAAVAVVVALATLVAGYAIADSTRADASAPVLGPGLVTVTVDIRYSTFEMPSSTLHVRAGTTVRFLVRNHDPIAHEFVVGDRQVHLRHQRGRESSHPPVPGEVSVAADDVGVTFYRFAAAGRYEFACHLPGHYGFGMKGWIVVEA
jgi:uncharacterized cupredoxin-like copper-binding protein